MIQFLKKYTVFLFGLIIIPIFYLLEYLGVVIIPEENHIVFNYFTLFWGLVIGIASYSIKHSKKKKETLVKVLGTIILFIAALTFDSIMQIPDNPITLILLTGFWFGLAFLLIPFFIKKYWKLITVIYTPLVVYFIYLRLFSGDLEAYLKIKEDFPFVLFFIPIPILFIVWVFEQWKWVQNLKAEKAKTELSLLRMQINPHFFFNTLNNLYALTIKNSKQAPEVILKLSDMMRYTIYEGEKELVTLNDEIDYLNNYIELHKIRYKKSVDIIFTQDIDTSLQIAPLLFIILLENAFKHGIQTLAENAYIHMSLKENKEQICFEIENNFDPKEEAKSNGIGLKNLKKRLSLLYPQKHDLIVEKTKNTYKTTLKIVKHA